MAKEYDKKLSHLTDQGIAQMVNVGSKLDSARTAKASGLITMKKETLALIQEGKIKKGEVFTVARLAGINAAKNTWNLIPLAHQIPLHQISVDFEVTGKEGELRIIGEASTDYKTGVEMEALTAVNIAALTIYDMCKAVDRGMIINEGHLMEKTGGTHGDFHSAVKE